MECSIIMSDEADESSADENGPENKPEYSSRAASVPKGTVGGMSAPSLGLGLNTKIVRMVVDVAVTEHTAEQEHVAQEDTRPIAVKTGDDAVDQQSEEDGFHLKSIEEIEAEAKAESESAVSMPEPASKDLLTPKTNDREMNAWLEKEGYTLTTDHAAAPPEPDIPYDRPRGTNADLQASFKRAHNQVAERQKSQGNEIE